MGTMAVSSMRGVGLAPGPGPMNHAPAQRVLLYSDVDYFNLFWWCPWFGVAQITCAANQMMADFAISQAIFLRDTTVRLQIWQVLVHTPAHNGNLLSTDPNVLLSPQLRDDALAHVLNCAANICSPNFHVVHLFSGKQLNGFTIGVAFQPGHFSLSQHIPEPLIAYWADPYHRTVAVVTHEVGHNYNGDHGFAGLSNACLPWWLPGWTIMAQWRFQPRACAFSGANAGRIHAEGGVHALCVVNQMSCLT